MTIADWILFLVVGTLATNHILVRLPGWQDRAWLFWLVQAANVAAAGYLVGWGLPGFDGDLAMVNYVIALLFVIRAVQNNNRWGTARAARRDPDASDKAAKKAAIAAALARGQEGEAAEE